MQTQHEIQSAILVVDDDQSTLDFLSYHLEGAGYRVFRALSGEKALEIAGQEEVDVVLLDVYLPDGSGLELCSRLKVKAISQEPTVLVMSAQADAMQMAGRLGQGADDYLHKPVAPPELLYRVKNWILSRQAEMKFKRRGKSLCMILDSIQEMVLYIRPDYTIRWVNNMVLRETGKDFAQVIDTPCYAALRGETAPCPECPIAKTFSQGEPCQGVVQMHDHRYWYNNGYPLLDAEGQQFGVVLLALDVTEQEKDKRHIEYLALHDTLTGLRNRASFMNDLQRVLSQAKRYGNQVGLLFLDLNEFKQINDTWGHAAGDDVLIHTGQCIQQALRKSDLAVRLGGDEFAVILPQMKDAKEAEFVAQKILYNLRSPFVTKQGVALQVKCSIGVATYPEHGQSVDVLITRADTAMYWGKQRYESSYIWAEAASDGERVVGLDLKGSP